MTEETEGEISISSKYERLLQFLQRTERIVRRRFLMTEETEGEISEYERLLQFLQQPSSNSAISIGREEYLAGRKLEGVFHTVGELYANNPKALGLDK